ncbi:leucyl/phenylalanyl-tRNA--protein transferase [Urechidicola sp. KH5]
MHILSADIKFPPVSKANEYGMLAIGGDLSIERLKLAYNSGIFPWYSEGEPIVWYSPLERMVLFPDELNVSKSMRKVLRDGGFEVTVNKAFDEVIRNCKYISRKDEFGTWITDEMQEAYIDLNRLGMAKSIEVWQHKELVGGLYGVEVGTVFCGESMFSKVSNASKVAFIYLVQQHNYELIDCQIYNDHLASLGAREIDREEFMAHLNKGDF